MGDHLAAVRHFPSVRHRPAHTFSDILVGLSPARAEGIPQMLPGPRLPQHSIPDAHALTFKDIVRFNHQGLGPDGQPVHPSDRGGGLLRTFHRRGNDRGYVVLREGLRRHVRHLHSMLREPISRQAAIQHTLGVVHFPVAKEMDDAVLVTHPSSLSTTDEGASRGHDLRRPAALFLLGRHSSSPASSARSRMTTP